MIKHFYCILSGLQRTFQRLFNFSSVGVKALVINAEQQVLLIEHTYIDGWHLPGGGLARHETPEAAIIRELQEETGVVVKGKLTLFGIYTHQIMGADDYPILYIVNSFECPASFTPSIEIKKVGWFALSALPPGTTPETRLRIEEYTQSKPASPYW